MMTDLSNSVAILGRPYSVTRSRLGAITKVFQEKYLCDLGSMRELCNSIGEKLSGLKIIGNPAFSFLISFADQTHRDGVTADLQTLDTIPIGKQTERVVMRWVVVHELEGANNELSLTIRISNPINPLVFLQAALSKSSDELDNISFEMGSTCVTVDGAGQAYADEIFLRVKSWLEARNKPHPYLDVGKFYSKYEWSIDQLAYSLMPLLVVGALSLYVSNHYKSEQLTITPILVAVLFVLGSLAAKLNSRMAHWAKKSSNISLFLITNGDQDAVTKMAARAKNSVIKLVGSIALDVIINIAAGVGCWWMLGDKG